MTGGAADCRGVRCKAKETVRGKWHKKEDRAGLRGPNISKRRDAVCECVNLFPFIFGRPAVCECVNLFHFPPNNHDHQLSWWFPLRL